MLSPLIVKPEMRVPGGRPRIWSWSEHIAEWRGKQRDLASDADPLPRLQDACELLGSERSRQVHPPIEPRPSGG